MFEQRQVAQTHGCTMCSSLAGLQFQVPTTGQKLSILKGWLRFQIRGLRGSTTDMIILGLQPKRRKLAEVQHMQVSLG